MRDSSLVSTTVADPQHKLTGLLKEGERLEPLRPAFSDGKFRSSNSIYRADARGQLRNVGQIKAVYRVEKQPNGQPIRLVVSEANRETSPAAAPAHRQAQGGMSLSNAAEPSAPPAT